MSDQNVSNYRLVLSHLYCHSLCCYKYSSHSSVVVFSVDRHRSIGPFLSPEYWIPCTKTWSK